MKSGQKDREKVRERERATWKFKIQSATCPSTFRLRVIFGSSFFINSFDLIVRPNFYLCLTLHDVRFEANWLNKSPILCGILEICSKKKRTSNSSGNDDVYTSTHRAIKWYLFLGPKIMKYAWLRPFQCVLSSLFLKCENRKVLHNKKYVGHLSVCMCVKVGHEKY